MVLKWEFYVARSILFYYFKMYYAWMQWANNGLFIVVKVFSCFQTFGKFNLWKRLGLWKRWNNFECDTSYRYGFKFWSVIKSRLGFHEVCAIFSSSSSSSSSVSPFLVCLAAHMTTMVCSSFTACVVSLWPATAHRWIFGFQTVGFESHADSKYLLLFCFHFSVTQSVLLP